MKLVVNVSALGLFLKEKEIGGIRRSQRRCRERGQRDPVESKTGGGRDQRNPIGVENGEILLCIIDGCACTLCVHYVCIRCVICVWYSGHLEYDRLTLKICITL